ncbi:ABC-type dipeptide/oligopeptide/nickel transport system permease subunit [Arthrobacter sp. UYCu723]
MDASGGRIIFQHVLPNTASALIVQATVIMPVAVIGEALLSFLGLGIQPPSPSLGIMLSDAQQYIFRSPTAAIIPGIGIAVICLAFNLFGDALRDALDPAASNRK